MKMLKNKKVKSKILNCNFLPKNRSVSSTKNSFFPKNHKGTDKIISVYWFAILFIVAGAVVYMAVIFYGEPYDVREIEANILVNQIADCLSRGGYLNEEIINDKGEFLLNNDNFLETCNLNFNVEDFEGWKNDQHYVEVDFFNIVQGNIRLKDFCDRGETNCVERSFYVLDENDNPYEIKILGVVRKTEKNVK